MRRNKERRTVSHPPSIITVVVSVVVLVILYVLHQTTSTYRLRILCAVYYLYLYILVMDNMISMYGHHVLIY